MAGKIFAGWPRSMVGGNFTKAESCSGKAVCGWMALPSLAEALVRSNGPGVFTAALTASRLLISIKAVLKLAPSRLSRPAEVGVAGGVAGSSLKRSVKFGWGGMD